MNVRKELQKRLTRTALAALRNAGQVIGIAEDHGRGWRVLNALAVGGTENAFEVRLQAGDGTTKTFKVKVTEVR